MRLGAEIRLGKTEARTTSMGSSASAAAAVKLCAGQMMSGGMNRLEKTGADWGRLGRLGQAGAD